ncbi:P-type ATPase, cytoplasmic domain N [Phytophthora cactorum]|nr:P-type ATPase, cytoplasmic domain N [Phytophthora cactorum]
MQSLREHLLVPIDDLAGQRAQLVYAPNELLHMLPFAFSRLRLYCFLSVMSYAPRCLGVVPPDLHASRSSAIATEYELIRSSVWYIILHQVAMTIEQRCRGFGSRSRNSDTCTTTSAANFDDTWQQFERSKIQRRSDTGLDEHIVRTRRELFGANCITIDKPSVPELVFLKIVHPFYVFQVFSVAVWLSQSYTKYAIVIMSMSAVSLAYEIYSEVSTNNRLQSLVLSNRHFEVLRGSRTLRVHETGVLYVQICYCYLVVALPMRPRSQKHKASFLLAGSTVTRVFNNDEACKGVVICTGFSTEKGKLFRSILFPKPITFEFECDSYRYLAMLWAVAIAAFIKQLVDGFHVGTPVIRTLITSLSLVTVAVPPALLLVLTSGIGFSMHRLHERGIFYIDSQRVNSCGQLSFVGVAMTTRNSSTTQASDTTHSLDIPSRLCLAMATCHGLSEHCGVFHGYLLEIEMFKATQYTMECFEALNYGYIGIVTASDLKVSKYGIVNRFAFDPACQRSSVVVQEILTDKRFSFVKGSPEAVNAISITSPPDLKHKTLSYSADGYYCIGFGVKELNPNVPIDLNNREEVESTVEFEGLALFKNELKPETKSMLDELYVADIDIRVITGDNALTAVHVCRELEMKMKRNVAVVDVDEHIGSTAFVFVDDVMKSDLIQRSSFNENNMDIVLAEYDLAFTGTALDKLQLDYGAGTVRRIIQQTPVFACVRPQQKSWIVEQLILLGLVVGMCGDCTNDCGALKAAHVGLALSSAETAIVAPFTTKAKAITNMPVLIREGRCALTTSFSGFKYMALYPIIQLGKASVLAQVGTWADVDIQLTDNQYLWDDLSIVLPLALCMLYTGPSKSLSRDKPPSTLLSLKVVASIAGHLVIFCCILRAGI